VRPDAGERPVSGSRRVGTGAYGVGACGVRDGRRTSRRRPGRGGALAFLAAIALACTPVELEVGLATAAERLPSPGFVVDDAQSPQSPRYDALVVLDVGGSCDPREGCPVLWRAELVEGQAPRAFRYGGAPGFRDVQPPKPLRAGGEYQLLVSGESGVTGLLAEGELRFRVDAAGMVSAVP
jgi:hypothetical protein